MARENMLSSMVAISPREWGEREAVTVFFFLINQLHRNRQSAAMTPPLHEGRNL